MLKRTGITVGLGFLGGWLATLLSLPLAWMLGPFYGAVLITDGREYWHR